MRVDTYQMVPSGARGRDSVRIASTTASNEALFTLDLHPAHAYCPECWPHGGEIDIIEGVNYQ
ncbi:hypothetical protein BDZ89DRAFT_1152441 [Hymenopellis radicata]|nr:hypothetical protein BDZ89DRAFT_1152441 [Hymenopellis radicata]